MNILCVQETKWKRNKARSIGGGFKLLYFYRFENILVNMLINLYNCVRGE